MLLSSILQILDRYQAQPKTAEKAPLTPFEIELASAVEKAAGTKDNESEAAVNPELPKPETAPQLPPVSAQSLESFIRAITKFEKPEQRVVDVFE